MKRMQQYRRIAKTMNGKAHKRYRQKRVRTIPLQYWGGYPEHTHAQSLQKLLRAIFVARKKNAYEQMKAFAESRKTTAKKRKEKNYETIHFLRHLLYSQQGDGRQAVGKVFPPTLRLS